MMPKIEQPKHTVTDIIKRQGAGENTVALLMDYLREVQSRLEEVGRPVRLKTHQRGVTAYCSERKAFMGTNLYPSSFSTQFFTGHGEIPGIPKANWITGSDHAGTPQFPVKNREDMMKAVRFAVAAYDLAQQYV